MNPYCPTGISQGAVQERMDWYNVNVKAAVIAIAREQEALGRSIHIRHSWLFLAPGCGFELTGRDGTMIQVSVSLQSAVQVLIDLKGVEQLGWINIGDTVEVGTGEAPMFAKVFSQCLGQFLQTASDPGWFYDAVAPSIRF